jgi:D-alanyl-D-alanine carboxypeptidase
VGEFAANPTPAPWRLDHHRLAWVALHIVTAPVPILGRVTCHRAVIAQLRGALAEVAHRGLARLIDPGDYAGDYAGCYAPRVIARDPGPSPPRLGSAIDLNARANPQGLASHQDPRLVAIFECWGFTWGRWLVPDRMHVELSVRERPAPPDAARPRLLNDYALFARPEPVRRAFAARARPPWPVRRAPR